MDEIWEEYGLDEVQLALDRLFPTYDISFAQLLERLAKGDVIGVLSDLLQSAIAQMSMETIGLKNVFIWLLLFGLVSALLARFTEVFDRHQVADLSFYFVYLLLSALLLKAFGQIAQEAEATMENIIMFIRLMVPAYLLAIGFSTGGATAAADYQLMLLLVYLVEEVLLRTVIPLIYSYVMLVMINGIWMEERLVLLIELTQKSVRFIMKAAIWAVTGVSVFQALLTPLIDSFQNTAIQKAVSAIPGIGNAAESVMKLTIGSAMIIKNSIGIGVLMLLLLLCAVPLLKMFLMAVMIKLSAAFMGIVSDKRITACTDRTAGAMFLLLQLTGTVMLLFLIAIAIAAMTTGTGGL